MLRRALYLLLALALAGPLLVPSAALAQDDEVFVDPDSPAEKEYALPIDRARRDADPNRRPGQRIQKGAPSAPLFGAGIGAESMRVTSKGGKASGGGRTLGAPARGDGPRRGSGRPDSSERGKVFAGTRGAAASGLPRSDEVARLATSGATDGGAGGTTLLVGAAGGAILLAGIAGGLLLRRRRI